MVAALTIAGCNSDDRASIATDLQTAATDIANAAGDAANNAAEALARNIATQQGEEQFKNAGQELDGPLTCTAKVQDGVAKIDIDSNPDAPAKYGIRGIPTLILFKGGQVAAQKVGALSKSQLTAFIDSHL